MVTYSQIVFLLLIAVVSANTLPRKQETKNEETTTDLQPAASGSLLGLGNLFTKYQKPYYRPIYDSGYPSYGGSYYPSYGGSNYPSYGGSYYPSYGGSNYPSYGSSSYPGINSWGGSGSNSIGGGYSGNGWYGTNRGGFIGTRPISYGGTGTWNVGTGTGYGAAGYGGYGGNAGLFSYLGYKNGDYSSKKNLGYGYYPGTDRFGFFSNDIVNGDKVSGYRGYS